MGKMKSATMKGKSISGTMCECKGKGVEGENSNRKQVRNLDVKFISPQLADDLMQTDYDLSKALRNGKKVAIVKDTGENKDGEDVGEETSEGEDNDDPNWFDDIEFDSDGERVVKDEGGPKFSKEKKDGRIDDHVNDTNYVDCSILKLDSIQVRRENTSLEEKRRCGRLTL